MYYLLLEIGSYRQLTRLQPELISDLVHRVTDLAYRHGAVAAAEEGGLFLFRFPVLEEVRHGPVLDAAFDTRDILAAVADDLAGYSVVIDLAGAERDTDVAERLRELVLAAPLDGVIWLTDRASEALGAFVETVQEGRFTRAVERRHSNIEALGAAAGFAQMPEAVEEMRERMAPWINGEREPGILLVYGDELQGISENVRAAVEPLQNRGAGALWPVFVGRENEEDPYRALVRRVSEADLERAGDYLTLTEGSLYEEKLPLLLALKQRPFAGSYHRLGTAQVQSAYTLYLTARLRRLVSELAVPGVVIEAAHHIRRETMTILTGALNVLDPLLRPILVLTSNRDLLPVQLLGREVSRYEFPRLTAEEFAERATQHLSEPARRRLRLAAGMARTEGKAVAVYHHFSNLQEKRDFESVERPRPGAGAYADGYEVLARLPRDEAEFLVLTGETEGLFDRRGLFRIVGDFGTERVRLSEICDDLQRRGFLRDEETCLPSSRAFVSEAASLLGERAGDLRGELADWVRRSLEAKVVVPDRVLASILERAGRRFEAVATMRALLLRELDAGNVERAGELERDGILEDSAASEHAQRRRMADVYRFAAALRRLLLQEDFDAAERLGARPPESGESLELTGEVALQQGRLMLVRGRLTDALRLVKRAIMAFQEAGQGDSAARAQLEFGLVLLARGQLSEARDYFLLVQGDGTVGDHTLSRAELLGTTCLFLEGKYTRVIEAVSQHREMMGPPGFHRWLLCAGLLEARALFELGRYADAAAAFQKGMAVARVLDEPRAFRVHHLWAARCEVYLGSTGHARAVFESYDEDAEVLFFRAEAAYRDELMQQALDTLDEALEVEAEGSPNGGESFNWSGGFAAVEGLAIGRERGEPVLRNLIRAFRAYVMAHVGRLEVAMAEAHNLTRREQISPIDPYRSIYFYFYSVILAGSGPDRLDDPLTVLGKSMKHLRERTGRIDQYGQKTDFLYKNYWNRRLMDAAKGHNLL
ncbi:MAG: hypothetical protein ACLFPO_02515 [Spirochaetaceae bacterium]